MGIFRTGPQLILFPLKVKINSVVKRAQGKRAQGQTLTRAQGQRAQGQKGSGSNLKGSGSNLNGTKLSYNTSAFLLLRDATPEACRSIIFSDMARIFRSNVSNFL